MKNLIKLSLSVLFLVLTFNVNLKAQVSEVSVQVNWTSWASDNGLSVYSPSGELLLFVCDPTNCQNTTTNSTYTNTFNLGCFQDLNNYYIVATDAYGDGWNGTGNYVRVFSGGAQVLNYNLASGSTSGQQFFNVSGGGTCPTLDASVESVSGIETGCGLTSVSITAVIRNQGTTNISNFPITYSVNGGDEAVAGTYTGTIAPGATGNFNFSANINSTGNFNYMVKANLPGDVNAANDSNTDYTLSASNPHDFSAEGPLNMGFETSDDFIGWTTVNYNNDGGVWTLNGTTNPRTGTNAAFYNYNVTNAANDWMFSKCLSMVAGEEYNLDFYYRIQSATYPESFSVRLTSAQNDASTVQTLQTFTNITNTAYTLSSNTFVAPFTGEFYIGWYANSAADRWNIMIDDVTISKNSALDVGITAIINPSNSCGWGTTEIVTVTIENFGNSNISGIPLEYSIDGGAYISAGTFLGTINSGATTNYNFSANLSGIGSHTLAVRTALIGDEVSGNDESTKTLTPISKQLDQTIFTMGFETTENFGEWTILNANGDARQWEITTASPNTGTRAVRIRNTTTAANDWLFTPCISFNAGETYVVDFSYRARTAGFSENFQVLLTSATTATSTVSTIATYTGFGNTTYSAESVEFTVPSAGVYYIAFRSTSAASQRGMQLDDISIYNKAAYWLGNSSVWTDANNWSSTVPSSNSDVVIPTSPIGGFMPIITASTTIGNLTIHNNAEITFTNGVELNLKGDYHGNCTFVEGAFRFGGSIPQSITGNNSFNELAIDNLNGVSVVSGTTIIRSSLFLDNGTLETGSNEFIIKSDANGDARVAPVLNGNISGNLTVQRYIDAGATNWRFLASPVGGVDFEQWDDDMITSGFVGSDYPTFSFVSIYGYNESTPGAFSNGYSPLANSNQIMGIGNGYMVWSGTGNANTSAFTIDVTGSIAIGDANLNVSYTDNGDPQNDGWSLVGNPYASEIDWDSPSWVKNNISNAIYVWDPDASQYTSYIGGVGTNGGSRFIASGQAFWVQSTGAGSVLTATENVKTSTGKGFFKEANTITSENPLLRLKIQKNNLKDEIVIRFMDEATEGFDPTLDASKIVSTNPGVPAMYTYMDSVMYSINSLGSLKEAVELPIYTQITSNGNYTLSLTEFEYFDQASCIMLEDQLTGNIYNLKTFDQTVINLNASDVQPRFKLSVYPQLTKTVADATCNGEYDGKAVYSTIATGHLSNVFVKNFAQTAVDSIAGIVSDTQMVFNSLPAGLYFLTADAAANCPSIRDTFRINEPEAVYADFESVKIGADLTFQFVDYSSGSSEYVWNFGDGDTSHAQQPTHTYAQSGLYIVSLTTKNEFGCEDSFEKLMRVSKPANLEVNAIEELAQNSINVISQSGMINIQSNTELILGAEVMSIDGKMVKATDGNSTTSLEINTQSMSTGVYLVKVYTAESEFIEKVFVR